MTDAAGPAGRSSWKFHLSSTSRATSSTRWRARTGARSCSSTPREFGTITRSPQIADGTRRWAAVLRDAGVRKGDRIVVVLPKVPDWLFCMVAALRIGAVAVPSAEQLRAKDLLYRANHSGATTVVAYAGNAAEFDAMRDDATTVRTWLLAGGERDGWTAVDPLVERATPWDGEPTRADDPAYIVYTSGTTKDPKGVVHAVVLDVGDPDASGRAGSTSNATICVVHGRHRLGEVAVERAARPVVVRRADRAARRARSSPSSGWT